jgi:hypothetical protein
MEITRNVILDLLPLYVAKEASPDTCALVKEYLETDPELADIAKKSATTDLPGDIPIPLTKEDKMEAYKEAKRLMFLRTIILAAIISFSLLFISVLILLGAGYFISSP